MIVVDTNVIAYLLIDGDRTQLAEQVRKSDSEWVAPILWRSEMRNLLMLYVRRGVTLFGDAKLIMTKAESQLSGNEYDISSLGVIELAYKSGCTAYDCEFVAVAEQLGVNLVTSDKKILAAFSDIAVSMADFVS
ncbi:MAG: type II toxin-antitoxin system VapC family toxin [Pyrinomonadaceae bacterium]